MTNTHNACANLPPAPPPRDFDAVVESVDSPRANIRILRVTLPAGQSLLFRAGQYADLTLPGLPVRSYSIASAPDANGQTARLEFHIRNTGGAASQHIATQLKPGDKIRVRAAMGNATFAPGCVRPLIAIAGGMGLSPMKSIIESALASNHPGPIALYWGVNHADDLYLGDHFRALQAKHPQFRFIPVVRDDEFRPADAKSGMVGDAVVADRMDLKGISIFVAGPPAMAAAVIPQLLARGAARDQIHTDDSNAAPPAQPAPGTTPQ